MNFLNYSIVSLLLPLQVLIRFYDVYNNVLIYCTVEYFTDWQVSGIFNTLIPI